MTRDPIINHFGRSEDAAHQRAFLKPRSRWRVNIIVYPIWLSIATIAVCCELYLS